ncbi:acetyl-CoA synthetase-like protein [Aspergillus karnatakaensis]|uniref:acetyl-CoA synthetase-like protein n=1 Tax=Aspergillus karnatakaensis TaxID=1810916 RepID=UPI003CCE4BE8
MGNILCTLFERAPASSSTLAAESWGSTKTPLLHHTVTQYLAEIVAKYPYRAAIITSSRQVTYQELDDLSDALAQGLLSLGVQRSDRVAVSLGNCIEYGVILYACLKIGAIVVPLNPAFTITQLVSALDHISARVIVLGTEVTLPYRAPQTTAAIVDQLTTHITRSSSLQHLLLINNTQGKIDASSAISTVDYASLVEQNLGGELPPQKNLSANDIATIQFTSGTTSKPKAVCLTHRNILSNAYFVGQGMELTEEDVICCPPPLYHCFGLVLGLLTSMTHGATLLFPAESFNAEATLASIVKYRATALYGVPTMFLAELDLIDKGAFTPSDLSTLRTGIVGGSPIPPALRLQLHEKMNLSGLTNCYGLTESSPIVVQTAVRDGLDTKLKSVGRVLPHTGIRITARDDPRRTLRRGQKGEMQISGYAVMQGYWESKDETDKVFVPVKGKKNAEPTVWLRTGDEALMEEHGTVQITGRIKDIIIRGGENIYPAEIEDCLLKHKEILSVAVVGLPDARYGETVAAFVQLRDGVDVIEEVGESFSGNLRVNFPSVESYLDSKAGLTADQIRSWVRDRLGKSLGPKYVFWVSGMPLTTSGKIEKFTLRRMGEQWLNGTSTGKSSE